MATTSKAPKSAKAPPAAPAKTAPRGAVKAKAKTPAAAPKPAKPTIKKATPAKATVAKVVAAKPAAKAVAKPPLKAMAKPTAAPADKPVPLLPKQAKTPLLTLKSKISVEQRRHYIEVAAYFIAERTGFSAANALDHWTQAEAEIDRLLREGKLNA